MHAQVYESLMQRPDRIMTLMAVYSHVYLRTKEGVAPASVFPAIRNKVSQFNSGAVAFEPESMETIVADSIARQRFTMILFHRLSPSSRCCWPAWASTACCPTLWDSVLRKSASAWRWARSAATCLRAFLRDGARMTLIGIAAGGAVGFSYSLA